MNRSTRNRRRHLLALVALSVCLYMLANGLYDPNLLVMKIQVQSLELIGSIPLLLGSQCNGQQVKGINTTGCTIADITPCHETVSKYIRPSSPLDCGRPDSQTTVDGGFLIVSSNSRFSRCTYEPIYQSATDSFEYGQPVEFKDRVLLNASLARVYCYVSKSHVYTNFHYNTYYKHDLLAQRPSQLDSKLQVFVLGLDSVSRPNLARQLPKFKAVLERKLKVTALNGYHKVASNTFVNVVPLLSGRFVNSSFDYEREPFPHRLLWDDFRSNGAVTSYAEDAPEMTGFNRNKRGFARPPTDLYMRPLSTAMYKELNWYGWSFITKSCAGNIPEPQWALDFAAAGLRDFRKSPWFSFTWLSRLTHNDVNDAGKGDEMFSSYIERLWSSGDLDNSVFIAICDHGTGFGPFRRTQLGGLEERLPFIYIRLPSWLVSVCPSCQNRLEENARRLTTPFDVHVTIHHLLQIGKLLKSGVTAEPELLKFSSPIKQGLSLFSEISPARTCEQAHISSAWCVCTSFSPLATSDARALSVAQQVATYINSLLTDDSDICEYLTLKRLVDAQVSSSGKEVKVRIEMSPGGAIFDATVAAEPTELERVNKYGSQSHCVNKSTLKPLCYCKQQQAGV